MGFWQWCKQKNNGVPNGISAGICVSTITGLYSLLRYEVKKWSRQEKEKLYKATLKGIQNKENVKQIAKNLKSEINRPLSTSKERVMVEESVKYTRNKKRI